MTDPRQELSNPNTTAERLAVIAQQHPDLAPLVLQHPNIYPGLAGWIEQYVTGASTPQVGEPVGGGESAQQPAQLESPVQYEEPVQPQSPVQYQQPVQPQSPAQAQSPAQPQGPTQPQQAVQPPPGFPAAPSGNPPVTDGNAATPGVYPAAPGTYPAAPGGYPAAPATPAGYPAAPAAPGGYPAAPGGPTPPKRKRTGLIIGLAAGLAVLLAIGGGVWFFLGSKLGGSASPEAAATKLIKSATELDPLSLYGSLAPSEFQAFEPAIKSLSEAETSDSADAVSAQELISSLKREVKTKITTPLESETFEIIADEVERVTFTGGVIEIDGDPEKIANAVFEFYAPILEEQMSSFGWDPTEEDLDSSKQELVDELRDNLPFELDFSDQQLVLVTAKEGGSWYVSPLLTAADAFAVASGLDQEDLGTKIIEGSTSAGDTPEAALTDLIDAVAAGKYKRAVSNLPLAERRVLSIYGDAFSNGYGIDSWFGEAMQDLEISVTNQQYSSVKEGSHARIAIEDLTFETYPYYADAPTQVQLSGTCATISGEEYDYYSNRYRQFSQEGCLTDVIPQLSPEDWRVIAVQEDGSWRISPIGTAADIAAIVSDRVQKLMSEGSLDELFMPATYAPEAASGTALSGLAAANAGGSGSLALLRQP